MPLSPFNSISDKWAAQEQYFWDVVEGQIETQLEVEYANDLDVAQVGSGFTPHEVYKQPRGHISSTISKPSSPTATSAAANEAECPQDVSTATASTPTPATTTGGKENVQKEHSPFLGPTKNIEVNPKMALDPHTSPWNLSNLPLASGDKDQSSTNEQCPFFFASLRQLLR